MAIIFDMPFSEYDAIEAASTTRLKRFDKSPFHCRQAVESPPEPTPAMRLGQAFHCRVLKPRTFERSWCNYDGRRAGAAWEKFQADNADKSILSAKEWSEVMSLADAVELHPRAAELLRTVSAVEVSVTWLDEESTCACKCRTDAVCETYGSLLELKTTQDASEDAFMRQIFNLRYHWQAALNIRGWQANEKPFAHFVFIAVEKDDPRPEKVAIYRLMDDCIELGRQQLAPLLKRYHDCCQRGEWPGYSPRVKDIYLPPWAWNEWRGE